MKGFIIEVINQDNFDKVLKKTSDQLKGTYFDTVDVNKENAIITYSNSTDNKFNFTFRYFDFDRDFFNPQFKKEIDKTTGKSKENYKWRLSSKLIFNGYQSKFLEKGGFDFTFVPYAKFIEQVNEDNFSKLNLKKEVKLVEDFIKINSYKKQILDLVKDVRRNMDFNNIFINEKNYSEIVLESDNKIHDVIIKWYNIVGKISIKYVSYKGDTENVEYKFSGQLKDFDKTKLLNKLSIIQPETEPEQGEPTTITHTHGDSKSTNFNQLLDYISKL